MSIITRPTASYWLVCSREFPWEIDEFIYLKNPVRLKTLLMERRSFGWSVYCELQNSEWLNLVSVQPLLRAKQESSLKPQPILILKDKEFNLDSESIQNWIGSYNNNI